MKARKIVLIFVLISTLIINGCTINKNTQYSFDNQEIAAYIDGEPMYGLFGVNRNDYVEMKTAWMQYYISEYGDVTIPTANEMVGELFISLRDISQQIYYAEYANKYLEMSDSEKAIDYYIVLMKYSEGYVTLPQDEDTKKGREDYAIEQVNGIKQLDKEEELYKQLNELAKKYDITFDEASERFLKPFILIYIIDFGFRPPEKFIKKHYKRKTKNLEEVYLAMNLTKDNYKEYSFMDITEDNYEELCGLLEKTRNYMLDLRMQYIDYMADFIEKADIIERP